MRIAAQVRQRKVQHPELYCADPRCLFRTVTPSETKVCPKHPTLPPAAPLAMPNRCQHACNRCGTTEGARVEAFLPTVRYVVCARCAVTLANEGARIVAHVVRQESLFVASDGWYSPRTADVTTHQQMLDAAAERFASRINATIARRGAGKVA